MYRVFLADDEVWVLFGLKKLISKSGLPFQVIGEAANGVTTLEELETKKPDVLISDIRMPGLDGLDGVFQFAALRHFRAFRTGMMRFFNRIFGRMMTDADSCLSLSRVKCIENAGTAAQI